jgi:hypothetical protein
LNSGRGNDFSLLQTFRSTVSGAHMAFYLLITGVISLV